MTTGLQANAALFDAKVSSTLTTEPDACGLQTLAFLNALNQEGQEHLFADWKPPGEAGFPGVVA